jgi:hypothetical protein
MAWYDSVLNTTPQAATVTELEAERQRIEDSKADLKAKLVAAVENRTAAMAQMNAELSRIASLSTGL